MFATPLRHTLRNERPNQVTGNMIQRRFLLSGNGLIFNKPLILKVFGCLQEKDNGYEEGCTRGANF
jgi:hypothetical protein